MEAYYGQRNYGFCLQFLLLFSLSVREWKLFSFSKLLKDHSRLPFLCHYEGFILIGTALTHCRTYYGHTPQLSFMQIYAQRAVIPGSVIVDGKRSCFFIEQFFKFFMDIWNYFPSWAIFFDFSIYYGYIYSFDLKGAENQASICNKIVQIVFIYKVVRCPAY